MRRDETLAMLATHREELRRRGVKSLAIFGSVARDGAGPESDVDVLVDLDRPMGLFGFLGIQEYLEGILGRPVDLVMRGAIRKELRGRILAEAVDAP